MNTAKFVTLGLLGQMHEGSGYDIIHEIDKRLLSMWTDIKPGSVYNALSTLEKEGAIEQTGKEKDGLRPTKTLYKITEKGQKEYHKLQEESFMGLFPAYYGFNLALVCNHDKHPEQIKEYGKKAIERINELLQNIDSYKYNFEDKNTKTEIPNPNLDSFSKIIEIYKSQLIFHLKAEKNWITEVINNAELFNVFVEHSDCKNKEK